MQGYTCLCFHLFFYSEQQLKINHLSAPASLRTPTRVHCCIWVSFCVGKLWQKQPYSNSDSLYLKCNHSTTQPHKTKRGFLGDGCHGPHLFLKMKFLRTHFHRPCSSVIGWCQASQIRPQSRSQHHQTYPMRWMRVGKGEHSSANPTQINSVLLWKLFCDYKDESRGREMLSSQVTCSPVVESPPERSHKSNAEWRGIVG